MQPSLSALRHYRLAGFSLERLMNLLMAVDFDVEIVLRKKPRWRKAARIKPSWGESARRATSGGELRLEDEPVDELGLRKAIQQAFAAEAGERELVLYAELPTPLDESRLYGGDDVLVTVALHMTTVSR